MPNWKHELKIKDLMTRNEDPESVDQSMRAIADKIRKHDFMSEFDTTDFYNCLEDENPLGLANGLLDDLYDFADFKRIWIE
jgi:hypothetical protein